MNLSSPDGALTPPVEPGKQSKGECSKRPEAANRLWFAYFVAVVVWVCCAYAHFGKWIDEGDFFFVGNVKDGVQTNDSVLFYAAGQMSRAAFGGKASLYDSEIFRTKIDAIISPIKTPHVVLLQYPPQFFLSLAPLPSFSVFGAWLYSCVISAVCLVLAMRNTVFLQEQSKFARAVIMALAFLWYPSYWCFRLGQNSLALLVVVSFIMLFLQKKKFMAAGITTAIGVFKVQYLPIIVIMGLFQGGKAYGKGLAAGLLAVLLICLCCYGPANIAAFPHSMLSGEHANSAGPYMMDTLRGLLSLVPRLPEKAVSIISASALALAMVSIAYLWRKIYPRLLQAGFARSFELCGSVSMIVLMLTSLHSFIQDYSLLLIAGFWTYKVNQIICAETPDKMARSTNIFILILPAVSWAYGFLPIFCFLLKLIMWSAVALLVSNLSMIKTILKARPLQNQ